VLGIILDGEPKFNEHVSETCFGACRQINPLKRMSKYLDQNSCIQTNMICESRLEQTKIETITYGLRSLKYYGAKLWNVLPYSALFSKAKICAYRWV